MRYAEKVHFFGLLGFTFSVIVTVSLGLQKCYAPFWNRQTKQNKIFFITYCPQRTPSHLKIAVCRKSSFFWSPRLYVFDHCDRVFRPTEMLRTILELADQAEKNILYHLLSPEGSFILKKCGFHEICQKIDLFSFSGHPNGPKTTSHNHEVIMFF